MHGGLHQGIRTNVAEDRVNLLGLPRSELEAFVAERLGAKPFRARQLMKWIYRRGAADFAVQPAGLSHVRSWASVSPDGSWQASPTFYFTTPFCASNGAQVNVGPGGGMINTNTIVVPKWAMVEMLLR